MRSILFFDLPQVTLLEKRIYRKFVKDIEKLGFYRIQESVFVKLSIDNSLSNATIRKIKSLAPTNGSIFILTVTEKQFSKMEIIIGDIKTDVINSTDRLIVL